MISTWLEDPYFDLETKTQVRALFSNPAELENAFFADLKFGTGGLRGIMGVGTYRINIYTIRKATQALANYLNNKNKCVVIGYDNRHNSQLFAQEAARVLAGNGIPVFLCSELRPTPFISFACRHLSAQAAIMITASHNPKEYNGYKVFWDDGAQVVSPHDKGIMHEMDIISSYSEVNLAPIDHPLIQPVDPSVDTAYLSAVASLPFFSPILRGIEISRFELRESSRGWSIANGSVLNNTDPFAIDQPRDFDALKTGNFNAPQYNPQLKICYSSLHGTGITLLPKALQKCGLSSPLLVPSQCVPDGDFPTTLSPNPESPEALQEGIKFLQETKSDILFVTDPDADRLGVVILHQDQPVILNGQQLAALGAYYLCQKASPHQTIITTLVTTSLVDQIAAAYRVNVIRTLTGFKYIGEKIQQHETSFLFGAEESHGYLIGTYCRDKDGISAACLFATLAAELKSQGKTCLDLLHEIYTRFGVFQEKALSLNFSDGKEGLQEIQHLMQTFRNTPPLSLGGQRIIQTIDYLLPNENYPKADVLQWILEDGTSLIIRPSGTEPKLKIYLSVHRPAEDCVADTIQACKKRLEIVSDAFQNINKS